MCNPTDQKQGSGSKDHDASGEPPDENKNSSPSSKTKEDYSSPAVVKEPKDNHNEESSKPNNTVDPKFSNLVKLAHPELPLIAVAILFMMGAEATNLVTPLIIANAYDTLVDVTIPSETERMDSINRDMILALVVVLTGVVLGFLRASILGISGERMVARLRLKLYGSILSQDISFFDTTKTGELTSRLGSDTTLLQMSISHNVPEVFMGILKVGTAVSLMFYISAKLAGLACGGLFLIFLCSMPFGILLGKFSKLYQERLGLAQARSTEALSSIRTVQAFAAEMRESLRYGQSIGNPDLYKYWIPDHQPTTYRAGVFKALIAALFFTLVFGVGFGFLYVNLWYGFHLVNRGELSLGDLTAFQSYIFTIGFGLGTTRYVNKYEYLKYV